MSDKIKCTECGADRKRNQYSAMVRMGNEEPVCNQCKYKYPVKSKTRTYQGVKLDEFKLLPCLGTCGKSFMTTKNIRFCKTCKPTGEDDNHKISIGGD